MVALFVRQPRRPYRRYCRGLFASPGHLFTLIIVPSYSKLLSDHLTAPSWPLNSSRGEIMSAEGESNGISKPVADDGSLGGFESVEKLLQARPEVHSTAQSCAVLVCPEL